MLSIMVNILLFTKGGAFVLFYWLSVFFAPSSRPSYILFLWFPKLLLDTVKFGTGERTGSTSQPSLVESARLSSAH